MPQGRNKGLKWRNLYSGSTGADTAPGRNQPKAAARETPASSLLHWEPQPGTASGDFPVLRGLPQTPQWAAHYFQVSRDRGLLASSPVGTPCSPNSQSPGGKHARPGNNCTSNYLSTKRDSRLIKITTSSVAGVSTGLVRKGTGCGFLSRPP